MKIFSILFFILLFIGNIALAQQTQPIQESEKGSVSDASNRTDKGVKQVSGTVRVRVIFDSNGNVTGVVPVSELPYGLTEQAVKAAKQIKFDLLGKNGLSPVEYTFSFNVAKVDEKSEAIVQKAVQKLGGERYLSVKTITARGNLTSLKEGESGVPSPFVDYIIYPDKERTEFKTEGGKTIQANFNNGGWIADGAARTIKDQTPEQLADFKNSLRTGLDNFLRGGWRQEKDAKLEYVGRREAGLGRRNEVIRLTYADGLAVEFEFAATDGTPAKVIYKRQNTGEEIKEEDRFAQFVETGGVFAPYIIDHYRNGKQTSRVNYESIEFNSPVPDALFVKPKDVKKLK